MPNENTTLTKLNIIYLKVVNFPQDELWLRLSTKLTLSDLQYLWSSAVDQILSSTVITLHIKKKIKKIILSTGYNLLEKQQFMVNQDEIKLPYLKM